MFLELFPRGPVSWSVMNAQEALMVRFLGD